MMVAGNREVFSAISSCLDWSIQNRSNQNLGNRPNLETQRFIYNMCVCQVYRYESTNNSTCLYHILYLGKKGGDVTVLVGAERKRREWRGRVR
jgi:hypothetical protein